MLTIDYVDTPQRNAEHDKLLALVQRHPELDGCIHIYADFTYRIDYNCVVSKIAEHEIEDGLLQCLGKPYAS